MSYSIRNFRMRADDDRWGEGVVAQFDSVVQIGVEPFTEELIFRECDLIKLGPGSYRLGTPTTEDDSDAFSLPSGWITLFLETAQARYERNLLFRAYSDQEDVE